MLENSLLNINYYNKNNRGCMPVTVNKVIRIRGVCLSISRLNKCRLAELIVEVP